MPTIPIFIREKQYQQLREISRITGKTIGQIVREAIQLYLRAQTTRNPIPLRKVTSLGKKKEVSEG